VVARDIVLMIGDDGPIIGDVVPITRDVVWVIGVGGLVAKAIGASVSVTGDTISEEVFGGLMAENAI